MKEGGIAKTSASLLKYQSPAMDKQGNKHITPNRRWPYKLECMKDFESWFMSK